MPTSSGLGVGREGAPGFVGAPARVGAPGRDGAPARMICGLGCPWPGVGRAGLPAPAGRGVGRAGVGRGVGAVGLAAALGLLTSSGLPAAGLLTTCGLAAVLRGTGFAAVGRAGAAGGIKEALARVVEDVLECTSGNGKPWQALSTPTWSMAISAPAHLCLGSVLIRHDSRAITNAAAVEGAICERRS